MLIHPICIFYFRSPVLLMNPTIRPALNNPKELSVLVGSSTLVDIIPTLHFIHQQPSTRMENTTMTIVEILAKPRNRQQVKVYTNCKIQFHTPVNYINYTFMHCHFTHSIKITTSVLTISKIMLSSCCSLRLIFKTSEATPPVGFNTSAGKYRCLPTPSPTALPVSC